MPIYKIGPRYLYLVIKICIKPKSFNIVFVSNLVSDIFVSNKRNVKHGDVLWPITGLGV